MNKFLKRNREDLKDKIYSKLALSHEEEERDSTPALQLDRALREAEKKKIGIRKLVSQHSPHLQFSDEMAQLRWRIQALRNFTSDKRHGLNNPNSTSLTGNGGSNVNKDLTFDELYEQQKKKFNLLKQRRKTKTSDPKYIEMIGNLQARKEKRKSMAKSKVDQQMQLLNQHLSEDNYQ